MTDLTAPPYEFAPDTGADSPVPILRILIADYPEIEHLHDGQARIAAILYDKEVVIQGRVALAYTTLPRVQGRLSPFFAWLLRG